MNDTAVVVTAMRANDDYQLVPEIGAKAPALFNFQERDRVLVEIGRLCVRLVALRPWAMQRVGEGANVLFES